MPSYRSQRNYGCRVHDQYRYFDMRTVVLENELVRISILVDKGTEIFEFLYKPKDLDFMWLTENGVQNPSAYLPTSPDPISTFIDYYPGGWQEVFPNGGPTSTYLGAQFGQHGEVAHMPWEYNIMEDTPARISVQFCVKTKKLPCQIIKTLTLESGSSSLLIEEQLENFSDVPLRYMWGQHIAFGKPFLVPGCRIKVPNDVRVITDSRGGATYEWPYVAASSGERIDISELPAKGTPSEMMYLTGFGEKAWYKLENNDLGMGMHVEWDGTEMPYLWYWQEYGATEGYPWFGRHYNIGLEPFSSYPTLGLEEAIRNDSAGSIGPREMKTFRLKASPYQMVKIGM
ncbi:hypothetical protein A8709_14020 [Paenibacillus pectinilyticus]|uniref:DUF4432 domain-containing protein n=1 Tax=Paenibacillus pectinilyticus TaxID=512399 RepID=A0A1C1A3S7_9BACL|nr:DUF4432 family protein [Paenibacillus pectinilyticus]OCT15214.1 hypothetical protein A8709_14020 [Paenibacillus pectinilyticus]